MTKDFLIDINPDIELPKYELVLTKLTEEPITSLKNITDLEYNAFYVGIDELNFNIPFYRTEDNGDKVENEIYSLVEGDHLILVNDMKYFIINSVVEKADESGKVWKEVHCYSREYELSKKKLIDYKADSRLLYDDTNSTLDGLEKGILNYIFNHIVKSWTIGYVDPDIILREGEKTYRSLNFSNSNLTQVFNDLQRTYGCVFKFDTIKQEMNIYSIDKMMGQHRGLYISDGNFIKNISKDINTDEIITRLYIYGKDNISIQSISPTGLPYIDNLNYYKNTLNKNGQPKYMTQDLIDALDNYYTKIENYNPDFEPLLIRLQEANTVMEDLINADHIDDLTQKGLIALERYLSNLQTLIDVKVEEIAIIQNQINKATGENLISLYGDLRATESALDNYNTDKDNVNNLIVAKKTEINNQQQVIDGIESELKALQDELNMSNSTNFTTEQLKELDKFIKVDIYNNSDYTENNIQELYDEGKKILNKASQPKIQFEVDVIDFLSLVECQHIWDKFTLGDIVTLEHKAIGFNYDVRLVGYEYNIDDNNLTLKFSNTDNFDNASLYLENLLDDFNTTGAVVDFNKDKWNNVGNVESRIAKMVDAKLEEARQNILNAVGQRYLFDDSGLWLYKENPDGTINPRQIRGINDTIALTDDNFTSVKTAITPDGINAELVRGKLGEFAQISVNQILMGGVDGTIKWVDIDEKPNDLVTESSLTTELGRDYIITGKIKANQITIGGSNGTISFSDLSNKPWIPQNAGDVGARPDNWVPTWAQIQSKPTILSADDIKTTVITKDWIGTLGLMVGSEIQMGDNAKITWANVTNRPRIPQNAGDVGARPDNWVPTWAQIQSKPTILSADDIKTTVITKDWIGTLGLMVGSEIQMGDNAKITWANVTNRPTIPTQYTNTQALQAWVNSNYATNITSTGLYTGTITANKVVSGLLQSVDGGTWIDMSNGNFNFKNSIIGTGTGNLTMKGIFRSHSNNNLALQMEGSNLFLFDWQGTAGHIGSISTLRQHSNNSPSISVGHESNASLSLSYSSGSSSYPYVSCDMYNRRSDSKSYAPITLWENTRVDSKLYFGNYSTNAIFGNSDNGLSIQCDYGGGLWIGDSTSVIEYRPDSKYPIILFDDTEISKDLYVYGRKDCIELTENYGERLLSAYETTEYYYGDIGSGIINENGECLIHIDEVFQECANTNINYHVFTQKYNGDISKITKDKSYFIVYGEPNTEFSWELKAKRINYEEDRLVKPNITSKVIPSNIESNVGDGNFNDIKDVNNLMNDILSFDLSELLLKIEEEM